MAGTKLLVPNPVRLHEKRFASTMAARTVIAESADDLVVTAIDDAHLESANNANREEDSENEFGFRQAGEAIRHQERMLENGDVGPVVAGPLWHPEGNLASVDG